MTKTCDIILPREQQEGTESLVSNWLKDIGDHINEHEPIVEISTDKVMVEIASPASGILIEKRKSANDAVQPGEVLGVIALGQATTVATPSPKAVSQKASGVTQQPSDLSPAVRRMLKEHGLEAADITGSGRDGRITLEDVERHLAAGSSASSGSRRIVHTAMRKSIAQRMQQSLSVAPHVTSVFELDLSAVQAHRESNRAALEGQGAKLTYTAYFVAAAAKALVAVPEANSRWHDDALEIFEDANIGIATSLGDAGLIVPVIKRAQTLTLRQIATNVSDLVDRARQNKLDGNEVRGGTFTISNHGVSGSLMATPIIINQPQSAILGIGKLEQRAVVREQKVVICPMLYVTLTIDHRVLDGFSANRFLDVFCASLSAGSDLLD